MNKIALILILGFCSIHAIAGDNKRIPFNECFSGAANRFAVNKVVLVAIANTESGFNPAAINNNNIGGTFDIGVMQINSSWLPKLEKLGIKEHDLLNACTNIYVGAWILSHNIKSYGNTWRAVGYYNATSPIKQVIYINKVMVAAVDIKQNFNFK